MSIRPNGEFQRRFGAFLRYWRTLRRWTPQQLAQHSGVSRSSVRRLERGLQGPNTRTARALAAALRCPLEALVSPPNLCVGPGRAALDSPRGPMIPSPRARKPMHPHTPMRSSPPAQASPRNLVRPVGENVRTNGL